MAALGEDSGLDLTHGWLCGCKGLPLWLLYVRFLRSVGCMLMVSESSS